MIRKIIRIDEEKCNGCGACAAACHEGAIEMIDGKAKLTREDYCDGLPAAAPAPSPELSAEKMTAANVLLYRAVRLYHSQASSPSGRSRSNWRL